MNVNLRQLKVSGLPVARTRAIAAVVLAVRPSASPNFSPS